jgi:16S rRNA (cytosine967-C5)-methyltransferase
VRQSLRQKRLLLQAAALVRRGGRLVYSACTLEPEETEDVVEALLSAQPGMRLVTPPDWALPYLDGGFLRIRPERDRGDGFFAAVLERS